MNPTKIRNQVSAAYGLLSRACDLATYCGPREAARCQDLLRKADKQSLEVERGHRRFMRQHGSYVVGAECAANHFNVKHVAEALRKPPKRPTWSEAAETRVDVVTCYAIAEGIRAALRDKRQQRIDRWGHQTRDYAADRAELRKLVTQLKNHPALGIDYAADMAA